MSRQITMAINKTIYDKKMSYIFVLAAALLRRKLGVPLDTTVVGALVRGTVAALLASAVGLYATYALGGLTAHGFPLSGFVPAIISMIVIGLVVTLVFVGVLALIRSPELRDGLTVIRPGQGRNPAE